MCCNNGWGGNSCLWIILILIIIFCCGCGSNSGCAVSYTHLTLPTILLV